MRNHYLCVALFISFLALFSGHEAFAQGAWAPIGGIPVEVAPGPMISTPVAPPPPSMMPPAPPPAGDSFIGTGGTSEYGSTVTGGTTLMTTGTESTGPGMSQIGAPLAAPPYVRPETQTEAVLRELYPSGILRARPATRPYAGTTTTPGMTAPSAPMGAPPGPRATPPTPSGTPTPSATRPEGAAGTEVPRSGSTLPFGIGTGSADTPGTVGTGPAPADTR